jgi:GTP-binding protein EngB required for normal cell division
MPIRLIVGAVVAILALLVLFLVLIATDTALSVWSQLREMPPFLRIGIALVLVSFTVLITILLWRWFLPSGKSGRRKVRQPDAEALPPVSREDLEDRLVASSREGVDVSEAVDELREQQRRDKGAEIHIAVYGEVSSGKSSLVQAMLPGVSIETDPRAGTTRDINHYQWSSGRGDRIIVSDLPGFNLESDTAAIEECRRAHLVIFLCDSDLTASQMQQLGVLQELGKPLVLALNKLDRYSESEKNQLIERLTTRSGLAAEDVVSISTGGREEVVQLIGADVEQRVERELAPEI